MPCRDSVRACILADLRARLDWWRSESCAGGPPSSRIPDIEATLCRLGAQSRAATLTNMLLVHSQGGGSLAAAVLVDQGDKHIISTRNAHWPARTLAVLEQLSELQRQIDLGALPPLPPFTAIINPYDDPQQHRGTDWCGFVPLLSNSAARSPDGEVQHRDLLMPDYSHAHAGYLAGPLDSPDETWHQTPGRPEAGSDPETGTELAEIGLTNGGATEGRPSKGNRTVASPISGRSALVSRYVGAAFPRGLPTEREALHAAGLRRHWGQKRRALFWRGADTNPV